MAPAELWGPKPERTPADMVKSTVNINQSFEMQHALPQMQQRISGVQMNLYSHQNTALQVQ